jgi:hypothetical protein
VRRTTLADEGRDDHVRRLSPSERAGLMWQLALQAWMFKEGLRDEPRLRRDVVRTVRGVTGLTFDDAWENRVMIRVGGLDVPVLGRAEFVKNKRASGRPKDLSDLTLLPPDEAC